MKLLILGLVRFYKLAISPALPPACRYLPTCSDYCLEAVERYGAVRGLWLTLRRLGRCHPFHPSGYDPVPCAPSGPWGVRGAEPSEIREGGRLGRFGITRG